MLAGSLLLSQGCTSAEERRELGVEGRAQARSAANAIASAKGKRGSEEAARLARCASAPIDFWGNLKRALKRDPAVVESTWDDQCHRVRGRVLAVEEYSTFLGSKLRLVVSDGGQGGPVLRCLPEEESTLGSLVSGRPITVWGVGDDGLERDSEGPSYLTLESCAW